MPTGNLIVNKTNYSGEVVETLMVRATTGCEIVDGGHVYVRMGVKSKLSIPRIRTSGKFLQRRKEMPKTGENGDAKGKFNYDEKFLEPQDMMVYIEFNPAVFEHVWRPFQPTGEMVFQELPIEVQETLLLEVTKGVNMELGDLYINGKKGAGEREFFDGFIQRMISDAELTKIADAHEITDETILPALKSVRLNIPKQLRKSKLMKIFMGQEAFDIYDDVLTRKEYKHEDYTNMNKQRYKGYPIVVLSDLPKDVIFAAESSNNMDSNLWIGVNLSEDAAAIKVGQVQNSGELYFFKMLMKADTNTKFGEDISFWDGRGVPAPAGAPVDGQEGRMAAPTTFGIMPTGESIEYGSAESLATIAETFKAIAESQQNTAASLAEKGVELTLKEQELADREKALLEREAATQTTTQTESQEVAKPTKAAIRKFNKKDLEAFVADNKLDIEVKQGMTNDQLSIAIIEALGEEYFTEQTE